MIRIQHNPDECECEIVGAGWVYLVEADPLDFNSYSQFVCFACKKQAPVQWFMDSANDEWVAENYLSNRVVTCECGSASIGIKPFKPGHAWYCPVVVK